MRLDPDARLPISNDVQGLKTRLHDVFRDVAIKVNSIFGYFENGVADDIIIDLSTAGVVLKSSDGHYWRVTIETDGTMTTTDLGTTKP